MQALQQSDMPTALELCRRGATVEHSAASMAMAVDAAEHDESKLQLLVTHAKLDLHARDLDGRTCMHHACDQHAFKAAKTLAGMIDVNATDRHASRLQVVELVLRRCYWIEIVL